MKSRNISEFVEDEKESEGFSKSATRVAILPVARARRLQHRRNSIVVLNCPYCNGVHYHGTGTISGTRVADCGKGQYELIEISKTI